MFCDYTKLQLSAGDGGNGCLSFRREKFIAKGGPDGGEGGDGGSLFFKVSTAINTLTHLDTYKKFTADSGRMGEGQNKHGRDGEDLYLDVPLGTIVREVIRNEDDEIVEKNIIADLSTPDKVLLVAKGGRGGYGNAHFATSIRQAPKFAELGEEGEKIEVELELKLVADVGIIGIPSAGKSTLISVVSNAKPKIAEYHFTTLKPNLGVVKIDDMVTYVVADIPGLIENASEGKGLGMKFLRHVQRCRYLVHMIDPLQENLRSLTTDEEDPCIDNFELINEELKKFSKDLATKKQLIVINKSDVVDEETITRLKKKFEKICKNSDQLTLYPDAISAATTGGIDKLKHELYKYLKEQEELDKPSLEESELEDEDNQDINPDKPREHILYRPHIDNPKYFSVEKIDEDSYRVTGKRIEQIVNMTNFDNREARMRVEDVLKKMGITKELKRAGATSGSRLHIGKHEMEYVDPNEH